MYKYTVHAPRHVPRVTMAAYARHAFSLLPERVIRDAFSARDVKLDGQRCAKDAMVKPGAEVTLYTPYEAVLPVVYEDESLLAVDKPAGVGCDEDMYGSVTVKDWAAIYAKGRYEPRLCHRLDTQTSGLILLAKSERAEAAIRRMFAEHLGVKRYVCLVRGTPSPARAACEAWLVKDAKRSAVRILRHEAPEAKQIVTAYETLRVGDISLLRVTLHTGRTHQIRAHMAYLGYPLLGDDQYGDREFNRKYKAGRLMLRSVELTIDTQGDLSECDGLTLSVPYKLDEILAGIG